MRFKTKRAIVSAALVMAVVGGATAVLAHGGAGGAPGAGSGGNRMCGGHGMGPGEGRGQGPGHGGGDMMGIHALFAHRDQIRRTVTSIPSGVRTTTESDDPAVAAQLREHVRAMYARLKEGRPIHAGDPLFAALFENADKIQVELEETPEGITVTETSADPNVAALVRRHAEVVSLFLANGMPEMMRSH